MEKWYKWPSEVLSYYQNGTTRNERASAAANLFRAEQTLSDASGSFLMRCRNPTRRSGPLLSVAGTFGSHLTRQFRTRSNKPQESANTVRRVSPPGSGAVRLAGNFRPGPFLRLSNCRGQKSRGLAKESSSVPNQRGAWGRCAKAPLVSVTGANPVEKKKRQRAGKLGPLIRQNRLLAAHVFLPVLEKQGHVLGEDLAEQLWWFVLPALLHDDSGRGKGFLALPTCVRSRPGTGGAFGR